MLHVVKPLRRAAFTLPRVYTSPGALLSRTVVELLLEEHGGGGCSHEGEQQDADRSALHSLSQRDKRVYPHTTPGAVVASNAHREGRT
jgi:hypothetical protein